MKLRKFHKDLMGMSPICSMQKAYVLHYRPYRETSLIVDLFTERSGRLSVIARGAKRPKSLLRGLLQPFTLLMVNWSGKGDLPTLISAESCSKPFVLKEDSLICGMYINELLMRLLHRHDPYDQLFIDYEELLNALANQDVSLSIILRLFEKKFLKELGYALKLTEEADSSKPIAENQQYYYVPEKGFSLIEATQISHTLKMQVFHGKSILRIAQDDYSDKKVVSDAKRLMRITFKNLLGDKPLKTRELL